MTKTLADMTPEQRANCIGMWCEYPNIYDRLGIIYALDDENDPWILRFDVRTEILGYDAKNIIPRFDLPRAWTPDGQPVPGEWEDGHVVVSYDDPDPWILKDAVSIEGLSEGGMSYYDAPPNGIEVKLDKFGEGEGKARRWVGEWETA
ncbi:hypothetical protein [Corynebacterium striatum]|uniref:hypothetical protein n=1 Tax=Corynebacterium striatum TaxID=43770 RepID=UPI000D760530|nr:hypothetical protein [Corynebacterium striatum]PXY04631.1 hypothetical protein CKF53_09385 [Corynebacterium striatum]PXY12788.1 hypothetical protein CKF74_07300 [Corynebacterium striatum]